jgi:putative tryptophan/tyrosine transport system substrate-binding protein
VKRRDLLALFSATAIGIPATARAQRRTPPVIAILYGASLSEMPSRIAAFRKGLADSGLNEGKNVIIETVVADMPQDQLQQTAAELVKRGVAVIVTTGGPRQVFAAKRATTLIPIVFTFGGDPVAAGLVDSLSRPGGNLTGISIFTLELVPKQIGLLRELVPKAKILAVLVNPANPVAEPYAKASQEAATALGVHLQVLEARTVSDIDAAFATLPGLRASGLLITGDPLFETRREHLIDLAAHNSVPTLYFAREFVAAGGLASYGASFNEALRQAGIYAARILKGATPADLPVLQPTQFELAINLKTAKALALTIPQSLLLRADEVIQ